MSVSLKPCPFCGGEAQLWIQCEDDENKGEELGVVECPHCDLTQCSYDLVTDAVARWNARTERTCRNVGPDGKGIFTCSECGATAFKFVGMPSESSGRIQTDYCPSCGAKVVEQ